MPIEIPKDDVSAHLMARREVVGNVLYEGFALHHNTDDADAAWGIRRTTVSGTAVKHEWALGGRYQAIWNDRATYFDAAPAMTAGTYLFSGSVSTVAVLVPAVAGTRIKSFSARSSSENPATRRLEVSIDGGTNFWVLRPGADVGGELEGNVTQLWLRSQASTTAYEVTVTTE